MRNVALFGSLGLLIAAIGCEPVDDGAATRNKGWDGVLTDHVLNSDRGVFTDTDETIDVVDGCAKTEMDAHNILAGMCADCHGTEKTAQGLPPWNFVLDLDKMKSMTWNREGQSPIPFVDVGKPLNSAIYLRAGISRDMPPKQTDVNQPYYDRVTLSQASVLYQWIANCM
jgi:hypothetical protein